MPEPMITPRRSWSQVFGSSLASSTVRGEIARETEVAVARCSAGHEIVLRRSARPPSLALHDDRQLQLT